MTPSCQGQLAGLALLTLVGGVMAPLALVLGLARLPASSSSLLINLEAVCTLAIGALGYGISIGVDRVALRHHGAAKEAVIFWTAPFVGALFALTVLRETPTFKLAARPR